MTPDIAPPWTGRFPRNDIVSLLDINRRFNLAESTAKDLTLGELLDIAGLDQMRTLRLGYSSSEGLASLREAVGERSGVAADCVLTTTGTALGLALLALEVCRPGDEVVLVTPCFPPSRDVMVGCGASIVEVRLAFADGYRADAECIAAALSERTRLVCIASPQNPNGVQTPVPVLQQILRHMADRAPQALLFVDETYREATYGDTPAIPSAAALDPRVLTGSSVSKAHGAPGLRCGWLTVHDAALKARLTIAKMNLVISGSTLDEALAAALLRQSDQVLQPRRQLLTAALALVRHWQQAHRDTLDWVAPDAGALCCMRLRPEVFDDAAVARFWALLPQRQLQLADGRWFGEDLRTFRLGFGYLPITELEPALQALGQAMASARAAR
ncbi:pyridoxal phosphate-dependent aminotransferase [Pseudorhodoferax sp. Leaf267]|uniref:pyridoxal phosphate-dependent aminotransferase n=1 Tax=Pseudorhodoferax sp. Leaf267 TaxID=1736316 RepID=UPI0006F7237B|nr:pyridoxal phosphate-dependent aminotransferase [Pseudorhodoferax sp. Leaf267]KQP18258.1 aminotransferase [Pseudorhodoferax sp. Leaf267]